MSKVEKERFIVKFVESKGSNAEYAVKAYEVNTTAQSFLQTFFSGCSSMYIYLVFII